MIEDAVMVILLVGLGVIAFAVSLPPRDSDGACPRCETEEKDQ